MTYLRPAIEMPTFVDDQGQVINYGRRWRRDSPPEQMYSKEAHPQRFLPLLSVGRALIDHLRNEYEVAVSTTTADGEPRIRVYDFTPLRDGARLRITLDELTNTVLLKAGFSFEFAAPFCGCDACDDSVPELIDELEAIVFATVQGGLFETVQRRNQLLGRRQLLARRREVHSEIQTSDGSGRTSINEIAREDLSRLQSLGQPTDPWTPWALAAKR